MLLIPCDRIGDFSMCLWPFHPVGSLLNHLRNKVIVLAMAVRSRGASVFKIIADLELSSPDLTGQCQGRASGWHSRTQEVMAASIEIWTNILSCVTLWGPLGLEA